MQVAQKAVTVTVEHL